MNEKNKTVIVVISLIAVVCLGFSTYIVFRGKAVINKKITVQEHDIRALARIINQAGTEKYESRIRSLLNIEFTPVREEIIKAFARRDRQELLGLATPFYRILKKEDEHFAGLNWFLPDNRLFLQLQKPEIFGDDVSWRRHDIVAANRDHRQNSGYLVGCGGLAYRVVEPVNYQGIHLGVIDLALKDYQLVDTITKELNIPVVQVFTAEKLPIVKFSKLPYLLSGSYALQSRDLDLIKADVSNIDWSLNRQEVVLNGKDHVISRVITLYDYAGEPQGWILALLDISEHTAEVRTDMVTTVLVSIFLVMMTYILISRGYGRLTGEIIDLNQDLARQNLHLEDRVRERTAELENEQEKLFVTLRSIGDAVITTDLAGEIVLINKVTEQLTGWSQQEAMGRPLQEVFNIINEETGQICDNPVDKVLSMEIPVTLADHTTLISRAGSRYIIEDSCSPIFDKESRITGAVLVFRDVTEEIKTAAELLKVEKLESVGVLAGGIAHDFNNILAAILGNIELAVMSIDSSEEAYSLLQKAKKASIRAKDLTQQLLTFAKGGDPVKKTAPIGETIIESANFVLHGSSTACKFSIPDDLWLVDFDGGQLSQVIQNLVINARQAMPEGGEIRISCTNIADKKPKTHPGIGGNYIKIVVADNGYGVAAKHLAKIFDPYFTTKQEGSGLGLATCYSIINKHNGHIEVRSKMGAGTTFTLYLPASEKQNAHVPVRATRQTVGTAKARILVMDDDKLVLDVVREMLVCLGHEVLLAKDGKQAIEVFTGQCSAGKPVDVIIMDLTIPGGMGGKEAVAEILKIDPGARVVVSSGYSNDPVMADYQRYGFAAAMVKPFMLAELSKTLEDVLSIN